MVHLLHGAIEGHIPELLVHVVVARSRLAAHPDAKVLDSGRLLLKNLHCKGVQSLIPAILRDKAQPATLSSAILRYRHIPRSLPKSVHLPSSLSAASSENTCIPAFLPYATTKLRK